MATRESIAPPDPSLLRTAAKAATPRAAQARLFSWVPVHALAYVVGDLLAVTLAHALAARAVEHFLRVPAHALSPSAYHRFYVPFFAVVLWLLDGYKGPELRRPEQELERSCKAVAVSFLGLILFNFVVYRSEAFSRYLLTSWFVLACVLLSVARIALRAVYERLWKAGRCRRKALLLGSPAGILEYQQLLSIQRHCGYDLAGALVNSTSSASLPEALVCLPVLGSLERWEQALKETHATVLILALPPVPDWDAWLGDLLCRCKQRRVDVELYSTVLATAHMHFDHDEVTGCFRFYARPEWSVLTQRAVKRGLDLAIGLVGSLVTLLLAPFVFVLVYLEDRGPLFYRSAYLGQDGRTRHYLKFRTMRVDADRMLEKNVALRSRFREKQKLIDDPRITRIGRLLRRSSLDEFPQLFSVLKGDLTFVGPRTIRQEETGHYGSLLPKLLSVKPGVTGFWQVMGRQTTTYAERVLMDMFYIDRWSIWIDLVIMAKTFWKVLRAEGAY